ncbi:hypothetical protein [Chenggangzhangella methanolivorans]|uniref:hypothetical protein n=1 Tax=Chenggangzhangella methanolivorans TaxID=1437009 RepID=UPI0021BD6C44|nr:hypothetical protein [Chenggangzhangella methanolivorans]
MRLRQGRARREGQRRRLRDAIAPQARFELPGGHHYDENYEALAGRIDAEFVKRAGP